MKLIDELSAKETRQYVTPYAFGVAPEWIGVKLATPFQRGIAMLLDLLCLTSSTKYNYLFLITKRQK